MCVLIDDVISNLLLALLASLVFYLIVEKYPRYQRMKRVNMHLQRLLSKIIRIGNGMFHHLQIKADDSLVAYKGKCKKLDLSSAWGVDISWKKVLLQDLIRKDVQEMQIYLEKLLAYVYYLDDNLLLEINKLIESEYFECIDMILNTGIEHSDFFSEKIYEYKEIHQSLKKEYEKLEEKKDDSFWAVCIEDLYKWLK